MFAKTSTLPRANRIYTEMNLRWVPMACRFHENAASPPLRGPLWAPSEKTPLSQPRRVTRTHKCHHLTLKVLSPSLRSQQFVRARSSNLNGNHKQAYTNRQRPHHHSARGILPLPEPSTARPPISRCSGVMIQVSHEGRLLVSTESTGNTQNSHFSARLSCLLPGSPSVQIACTISLLQTRQFSAFTSRQRRVSRYTALATFVSTCRLVGLSVWSL